MRQWGSHNLPPKSAQDWPGQIIGGPQLTGNRTRGLPQHGSHFTKALQSEGPIMISIENKKASAATPAELADFRTALRYAAKQSIQKVK